MDGSLLLGFSVSTLADGENLRGRENPLLSASSSSSLSFGLSTDVDGSKGPEINEWGREKSRAQGGFHATFHNMAQEMLEERAVIGIIGNNLQNPQINVHGFV